MKNIVFINMPLRESAAPNNVPLGILLMATNLRDNHSVECSIIDLNGYRTYKRGLTNGRHLTKTETYNLIKLHFDVHGTPDVVGLSGMITTLKWQVSVANMIKEIAPDCFLVSGGGLATELQGGLFNYIPELDSVVVGEGDEIIVDVLKTKTKGKVYSGGVVKDLDKLPFADLSFIEKDVNGYEMLEYYLGNAIWGIGANNSSSTSFEMVRSINQISSRGCPYNCFFCFKFSQGGRDYRLRSAENVALEFERHINKYNVDFIGLVDDNFAINTKRIKELIPLLKPLNIRWGTHIRMDEADERIYDMAEAGCIYVGFGAESASAKVLTAMNKGGFILKKGIERIKVEGKYYDFPASMTKAIRNCEYAGIHANCTWICGYPSETLEDLKMSVAFIKWQEDFYASCGKGAESVNKKMFFATFYPGTEMGYNPKVKKVLTDVFNIQFNGTQQPVCDKNLYQYLISLDDATKLLTNPITKEPINYSDMPMKTFLKCKELIDNDKLFEILEL